MKKQLNPYEPEAFEILLDYAINIEDEIRTIYERQD